MAVISELLRRLRLLVGVQADTIAFAIAFAFALVTTLHPLENSPVASSAGRCGLCSRSFSPAASGAAAAAAAAAAAEEEEEEEDGAWGTRGASGMQQRREDSQAR